MKPACLANFATARARNSLSARTPIPPGGQTAPKMSGNRLAVAGAARLAWAAAGGAGRRAGTRHASGAPCRCRCIFRLQRRIVRCCGKLAQWPQVIEAYSTSGDGGIRLLPTCSSGRPAGLHQALRAETCGLDALPLREGPWPWREGAYKAQADTAASATTPAPSTIALRASSCGSMREDSIWVTRSQIEGGSLFQRTDPRMLRQGSCRRQRGCLIT